MLNLDSEEPVDSMEELTPVKVQVTRCKRRLSMGTIESEAPGAKKIKFGHVRIQQSGINDTLTPGTSSDTGNIFAREAHTEIQHGYRPGWYGPGVTLSEVMTQASTDDSGENGGNTDSNPQSGFRPSWMKTGSQRKKKNRSIASVVESFTQGVNQLAAAEDMDNTFDINPAMTLNSSDPSSLDPDLLINFRQKTLGYNMFKIYNLELSQNMPIFQNGSVVRVDEITLFDEVTKAVHEEDDVKPFLNGYEYRTKICFLVVIYYEHFNELMIEDMGDVIRFSRKPVRSALAEMIGIHADFFRCDEVWYIY